MLKRFVFATVFSIVVFGVGYGQRECARCDRDDFQPVSDSKVASVDPTASAKPAAESPAERRVRAAYREYRVAERKESRADNDLKRAKDADPNPRNQDRDVNIEKAYQRAGEAKSQADKAFERFKEEVEERERIKKDWP